MDSFIDPAFHSPSRRASTVNLAAQAQSEAPAPVQSSSSSPPPPPPPTTTTSYRAPAEREQTGEDEKGVDRLRRRSTIAERMAKLGGIKFGAALLPTSASRPSTRQPSNDEGGQAEDATGTEQLTELSEEEEEQACKERIAAKMAIAAMGIYMITTGNKDLLYFTMTKNHILLMNLKVVGCSFMHTN